MPSEGHRANGFSYYDILGNYAIQLARSCFKVKYWNIWVDYKGAWKILFWQSCLFLHLYSQLWLHISIIQCSDVLSLPLFLFIIRIQHLFEFSSYWIFQKILPFEQHFFGSKNQGIKPGGWNSNTSFGNGFL